MSKIAEEKVFKHFLELPENTRMEMIDEMQPDDRCRLTRCSKQCNKEAKASKNFLHTLTLNAFEDSHIEVGVAFGDFNIMRQIPTGFTLLIEKNCIIYQNRRKYEEFWRMGLDDSVNTTRFALQFFKKELQTHENRIRKLIIGWTLNSDKLKNVDFGIRSFQNLEDLFITIDIDASQFISKVHCPLKRFTYFGNTNMEVLPNFHQIYQVRDNLFVPNLALTNDQFLRLSATWINIHIGQLTVQNIFDFIDAWRTGKNRADLKECTWHLYDSDFNGEQLFELLDVEPTKRWERHMSANLKQIGSGGKIAKLYYENDEQEKYLCFEINGSRQFI